MTQELLNSKFMAVGLPLALTIYIAVIAPKLSESGLLNNTVFKLLIVCTIMYLSRNNPMTVLIGAIIILALILINKYFINHEPMTDIVPTNKSVTVGCVCRCDNTEKCKCECRYAETDETPDVINEFIGVLPTTEYAEFTDIPVHEMAPYIEVANKKIEEAKNIINNTVNVDDQTASLLKDEAIKKMTLAKDMINEDKFVRGTILKSGLIDKINESNNTNTELMAYDPIIMYNEL